MKIYPNETESNVIAFRFRPKEETQASGIDSLPTLTEKRPSIGDECEHRNIVVDERLNEVRCLKCDVMLNPIWALMRMAREETRWGYELDRRNKSLEELDKRSRTTCQHCGKMTRISR